MDALAHLPDKLERIMRETRKRGYGTRDAAFTGGTLGRDPQDDGLAAIAVPLVDGSRVHGAINILFIRSAHTTEEVAARHLYDLQAAARKIVSNLTSNKSKSASR